MAYYISRGQIPEKRHTQFRSPSGKLYSEELVSTEGFSSDYSLLYHIHPPTQILATDTPTQEKVNIAEEKMLKHRSLEGFRLEPVDDWLQSRKPVLVNNDVHISLAAPRISMADYFFKNADADELVFVHEGSGKLTTVYGGADFWIWGLSYIFRGAPFIRFNLKHPRTACSLWNPSARYGIQKNMLVNTDSCSNIPHIVNAICARRFSQEQRIKAEIFWCELKRRACFMEYTMRIILLMWWVGMAVVTLIYFLF